MQFRPDIQGLRAIAVLAVIVFHLNPAWLPGGFVGVDIFLVISGFLISSILLHKKSKPGYSLTSTLGYFYTSRLKRIAPAYYATLVMVSLLAAVLFLPADFATYRDGLKKAAWFNSNSYFASFGDYFAPANHEQPLLHTWSLAVEIQFYLIAPFIFLLIPKRLLSWLLPLGILIFTAIAEYKLRTGAQQATYYSLLARLPAFFFGGWIALYIANVNRERGGDSKKLWVTATAFTLIVIALVWPKPTGYFPGLAGLIPSVAAGMIIWSGAQNKLTALLSSKTMIWVGGLSYSLYLWHWPVLAFMRYYTGAEILSWQYSLTFIVLTLALASASFYWIETPLRLKKSWQQGLGYACLVLVTLTTATGMKKINAHFTPEPLPVEYTRYADPKTICHGQIVGDCLKGDLNSEKEVLVLGDSHAAMLNHFFDYLGKELGFKARIITASSCVTIPRFDYQRLPEWAQKACLAQIAEAEKYISEAEKIFIAGMWSYQLSSADFIHALHEFIGGHDNLYFISQIPLMKKNPLRSLRFAGLGLRSDMNATPDACKYNELLNKVILKGTIGEYLDLSEINLFKSPPVFHGKLFYSNADHLNEPGSIEYARQSKNILKIILYK